MQSSMTLRDDPRFAVAVQHWDAGAYRDALLAFETVWFEQRNDFLRGLIQLCNALLQLRIGRVSAPRRTLGTAYELLAPYAPTTAGLDVTALLAYIRDVQQVIPPDLHSDDGVSLWGAVPVRSMPRA